MNKSIPALFLALSLPASGFSAVSFEEFVMVKDALKLAFKELRPDEGHWLSINPIPSGLEDNYWWNLDMVHASYVKTEDQKKVVHNIYLFGGFARLEGMTPDGLAVTGCHEIGHGLGGGPYKNPSMGTEGSSVEGQSDYYATAVCLPLVLKYLKQTRPPKARPVHTSFCGRQSRYDLRFCQRMFAALESDVEFFKRNGDYVYFDAHSNVQAASIDTSPSFYPDAQCRLDTMIHGILGLERPVCWYPPGAANDARL